jgi:alkanesulfonate monooxygenase SsuD/methylene tetrahydromethanopterin reductase-like flavin-dependent oxidoreductase (luciferase family)
MKFCYFHFMPWIGISEENQDWPVPNKQLDPVAATDLYRTYIDHMAYAEECGFDWVGCNEHHFSPYGLMSNPNLIGSALIQRTKSIKIAMLGCLLPLLNPIRVAEEYAMLDVMSGGRLIAGFMRGIPHEYVAYNMPPSESFSRMREGCELVRKAWSQTEPFGWEGEHYKFRAVSIWPRPRQTPHPPIMMSGSALESARFAAENRAKLGIVRLVDLESVKACIDEYRTTARANGWEPADDDVLIGQYTSIAETEAEAKKNLTRGIDYFLNVLNGGIRTAAQLVLQKSRYYTAQANVEATAKRLGVLKTMSIEERIEKGLVLCGTPDQVVGQIKRLRRDLGAGVINVVMKVGNVPDDAVHRGMTLFKDHVANEVRAI